MVLFFNHFSFFYGIDSEIQDTFLLVTRDGASSIALANYTGGVAGYSPEPSYTGSLLGSLFLILIVYSLRIKQRVPDYILVLFVVYAIVVVLLKSLMALAYFLSFFLF